MLFAFWTDKVHRPTKDMDLLGFGDESAESLEAVFRAVCMAEVEPDGMVYDPDSIRMEEIREGQEYHGKRVKVTGRLEQARISIQIDIGFGDAVTPEVEEIEFPALLDLPPPRFRAYPRETVVSEKLQAMVVLGMVNTRMKDFYDLWSLSRLFTFDGELLARAIQATFERRKTKIPVEAPLALTKAFTEDRGKTAHWKAFLKGMGFAEIETDLSEIVDDLRAFLLPPLQAAGGMALFRSVWLADGTWHPVDALTSDS